LSFVGWLDLQFAEAKKPNADSLVVWKDGRYLWAKRGAKQAYLTWHLWRERAFEVNLKVARDAINRTSKSTWWAWDDGSTPLFWRWPEEYLVRIRDGVPVYFQQDPPRNLQPQRGESSAEVRALVRQKLGNILERRYITPGVVESLTNLFSVPKGEFDVRMVFNGTASGLNESIWIPGFGMPTVHTHLRAVDKDVGEMFLNFHLHAVLQAFAVVDLTKFFDSPDGVLRWEV
jgi:hypothetical protein